MFNTDGARSVRQLPGMLPPHQKLNSQQWPITDAPRQIDRGSLDSRIPPSNKVKISASALYRSTNSEAIAVHYV